MANDPYTDEKVSCTGEVSGFLQEKLSSVQFECEQGRMQIKEPYLFNLFRNYYSKLDVETSGEANVHWNNVTSTPTTMSGYGITDAIAISGTPVNNQLATWVSATAIKGEQYLTFDGAALKVKGASYEAQLLDEQLNFTRGAANYIRATTASGVIYFITNGLGLASTNALLQLTAAAAKLCYGSTAPTAIKFETTNTGVKLPATDSVLEFSSGWGKIESAGGILYLNYDNSQTVVVGNPAIAKFITGAASELYFNGGKKLETTSTGVTLTGALITNDNTSAGYIALFDQNHADGYGVRINVDGTGTNSALIIVDASSTNLFKVQQDGKVAVGIASPQKKLHVAGTILVDGDEGGYAGTVGLVETTANIGTASVSGLSAHETDSPVASNTVAKWWKIFIGTSAYYIPLFQ